MSPRFALHLEGERFLPGETVRGTVSVLEGGRSRSLQTLLEFVEDTDDYAEVPWELSSGPLHRGDLETGMTFSFALPLPPEALPSYRSENGELYWRVRLKSDELGPDTSEHPRIVVEPQRRIAES